MDPMVIGVLLTVGGALTTLAGVIPARTVWRAREWPKAYGSIMTSRVASDSEEDTHYSAEIAYRYDVGETGYHGRGIGLYEATIRYGSGEQAANQAVAKYREGREVMVYYDPNKPTRSALEIELPILFILMIIGGPVLVGVGIYKMF